MVESLSCGSCSGEFSCQGEEIERREGKGRSFHTHSIKQISQIRRDKKSKKIPKETQNCTDSSGQPLKCAASCC